MQFFSWFAGGGGKEKGGLEKTRRQDLFLNINQLDALKKNRRQELIVNLHWLLRNHEHFSTYLFDQKLNHETITRNLCNLCLCLVYFFLYNGTSLEHRSHSTYFKLNVSAQGGRIICITEVPGSKLGWDVNCCE